MPGKDFSEFFAKLTGLTERPHDWQRDLAKGDEPRSRVVRIPTGMGKTLGVLAAWSWHRLCRGDDRWPRRLLWCLPMRVLVEQTEVVVREALERLGLLWNGSADHGGRAGVHLLMGGADPGGDWHLYPEECAVLIGTQDMLLSRALNRGYAAGRARWPMEFGLLNNDTLWVIDEAQLMDVGLATSAQLQAFLDEDAAKGFRPRHTWWMSATLQPEWLKSVDTEHHHAGWIHDPIVLPTAQRNAGLGAIPKKLACASIKAEDREEFAQLALDGHRRLADQGYGRITLVVCNTVARACETFDVLRSISPAQPVELVHSRFRPAERIDWRRRFLNRAACKSGTDRIIVATQVVEAGVDISAGCLITELAPWSSLVQRFGRCARYGGTGAVHAVDRGRDDKSALPYEPQQIEAAWKALLHLARGGGDVGIAALEHFEATLDVAARRRLYPYEPRHLLLRREFDELFDTTPDLTGADLDISRFIRSGDERDLYVCWLELPPSKKGEPASVPSYRWRPRRIELCAVPFLLARDWLCGAEMKTNRRPRLRTNMRAWVWDWIDGRWVTADRASLAPGRVVCVAADCGGYRPERGFDPTSSRPVPSVPVPALEEATRLENETDEIDGCDGLSASKWKTIGCHGREVAELVDRLAEAVSLPGNLRRLLVLAGRWHDVGKAHPAFQGSIRPKGKVRPDRPDLAKAPEDAWLRPPGTYRTADDRDSRPGLRHELASALALFSVLQRHAPRHPALLGPWADTLDLTGHALRTGPQATDEPTSLEQVVLSCSAEEFDLLAYLVACHHGKVRVALHAGSKDQEYRDPGDGRGLPIRGIREGDVLPSLALDDSRPALPPATLTLEPAVLGLSPWTGASWRERTLGLTGRFGPAALAWLEALIIAADRRASRLDAPDPVLGSVAEVLQ
jgi:CRISPR-associated endonuclease/helicase Cas3